MSHPKSEPSRRLFVALWPPVETRSAIERATKAIANSSGGRVIPAENLHITLVFLGAIEESRVRVVQDCVRRVEVHPIDLDFGMVKWWKRQELLCLEPNAGNERLSELVERLRKSLRDSGFEIELRAFLAHVTLARDVRRECAPVSIEGLRWLADRVELIESKISNGGSKYAVVPTRRS